MPFTEKMINQIKNGSSKAFAFKGEPDQKDLQLLDEYFWDFPNATKRDLRDGTKLYLVQRKKVEPLNINSLMDSLVVSIATEGVDIDALNETLLQMGGRKKRKSKKYKKSAKYKKSRKRNHFL